MKVERLKDKIVETGFWALSLVVSAFIAGIFAFYAEAPMDGYKKSGQWNAQLIVVEKTLPEAEGLETGDRIISVDGVALARRKIKSLLGLIAELKAPHSSAMYEVERNGRVMAVEVPLHKIGWWRMLTLYSTRSLLALFFIITASILFLRSGPALPGDRSSLYQSRSLRIISYGLVLGAVNITLGVDTPIGSGGDWMSLMSIPGPVTSGIACGLMLHFLLIFPPGENFFTRSRWAIYAIYGSYLPLAIATTAFTLEGKSAPPLLTEVRYLLIAAFILSAIVVAFHSYSRATCSLKKNQMRALAWGVTVGLCPWLFASLLPSIVGIGSLIDPRVVIISLALIPISLLVATSRHRLLEIDRLIRRSLVYTLALAATTGIYLIAFAAITGFIEIRTGLSDPLTAAVMSALLLAFAFNPLKALSERLVAKLFYRGSVNPREAFSQLSLAISQVIRLPQLVEVLTATVPRAFATRGAALIVLNEDGQWQVFASSQEIYRSVTEEADRLVSDIKSFPKLWPATLYPVVEQDQEKRVALPGGTALCFPMSVRGRLAGIYLLGEKLSDRLYRTDELDTLRTLAHHAATALDNACAYQRLNDLNAELEMLIELRTEQLQQVNLELGHKNTNLIKQNAELARLLEELRETQAALVEAERRAAIGEIVITVCHEINNPLSAIIGQAQLIQLSPEGVPDPIMEKVRIIDQCSDRIREITDKMRQLKTAKTVIYAGREKMIDIHQD
ncbi:MAG: hypothetical protein L0229_08540, partial [Blastocatellia bacterium]|nr:hypothetical protein [Blastocatellia bacterium]